MCHSYTSEWGIAVTPKLTNVAFDLVHEDFSCMYQIFIENEQTSFARHVLYFYMPEMKFKQKLISNACDKKNARTKNAPTQKNARTQPKKITQLSSLPLEEQSGGGKAWEVYMSTRCKGPKWNHPGYARVIV